VTLSAMHIRTVVTGALIILMAAIGAPGLAHADSDSYRFLDFLARNGEDVSNPEIQYAAIDYGYSICNLYRVSQSNDQVLQTMMRGSQNVAVFSVGSVLYLCPELKYLLP
jgi:hypothetical protein